MSFRALELSIDLVRSVQDSVVVVRRESACLADQLQRAAQSIALNLGEGQRRMGRDRRHHFRVAAGSASEVRCALRVAEASRMIDAATITESLETLDGILAILWVLTEGKRAS